MTTTQTLAAFCVGLPLGVIIVGLACVGAEAIQQRRRDAARSALYRSLTRSGRF